MSADGGLSTERFATELARVRAPLHVNGGYVFFDASNTGERF